MCQTHYLWETERDFLFCYCYVVPCGNTMAFRWGKKKQTRGLIFTVEFFGVLWLQIWTRQKRLAEDTMTCLLCKSPCFHPSRKKTNPNGWQFVEGLSWVRSAVWLLTGSYCLQCQRLNKQACRNREQWNISGVQGFRELNSLTPGVSFSSLSSAGERDVWKHSSTCLSLSRIPSPAAPGCLLSPQPPDLILGLWWDFGWPPQVRKSEAIIQIETVPAAEAARSPDHDRGNICLTGKYCPWHCGLFPSCFLDKLSPPKYFHQHWCSDRLERTV